MVRINVLLVMGGKKKNGGQGNKSGQTLKNRASPDRDGKVSAASVLPRKLTGDEEVVEEEEEHL